jgi:hypothetical protein
MSDDNPYGGAGQPPPPGSYPVGGNVPPQRPSDRWKIWLGIGLAIPALILSGFLTAMAGFVDDTGALSAVVGGGCLLAPIVMLFFDSTRKIAIGLIIGYAVIFILFAGACVALLASYN